MWLKESCCKNQPSITSAKKWAGGDRKWQFLLIYSTIYADVGGWVGLKKPKSCWRNTYLFDPLGDRGLLNVLNVTKLVLNELEWNPYILGFSNFRRPVFSKPVSWWGLFCCYSKTALIVSNLSHDNPSKIIITQFDKLETDKSSVVFILVMLLCILLWSSFSLDMCTPKPSGFKTFFSIISIGVSWNRVITRWL